jgi:thiol:disulfide interchange protein/DsbC/DsbD-like thiol-disulfide interchange protein
MKAFLTLLLALFFAAPAAAQIDDLPKVHARLIAEQGAVAPGQTVAIAFEQDIREGWHTYWLNPGDVGQPTTLTWSLPAGWKAGALAWPYPKRLPVGPFMDYGYEGKVWILTAVTAPADAKPGDTVVLQAKGSWLVCKEVCVPEDRDLALSIKIGAPSKSDSATAALFASARTRIPTASPWPVRYKLGAQLDLFVAAKPLVEAHPAGVQFFPTGDGMVVGPAAQMVGFAADGLVLRLSPGKKLRRTHGVLEGVLVLASTDGSTQALQISASPGAVTAASFEAPPSATPDTGIGLALLFAFLGGLILNLMPCVLPILAMKAFALSSLAGRDRREAVRESLAYGAGAILSFAALGGLLIALRAGGQAIGWGFQLQEPIVVAGFALLMFGVGLNLSGVFEVAGFGGGDALTRAGGVAGSFFTGVLAVAVAAPCTAPFMAAALGYALTQPAVAALAIFLALGLGFAVPFVLIGVSPLLMRMLPKPGAWMIWFKQALAFAMYGTAAWLVWVLAQQAGANAVAAVLAAMVAAGFAAWVWGLTRHFTARGRGIGALVTLIALLAALSCLWFIKPSAEAAATTVNVTGLPSEPYSEVRLARLRVEHRPVFVNATAAWCITCLVNDEAALSGAKVHEAFAGKHVAYLVADWTRRDPAITALLSAHGRSGVPLYLYYAPGAAEPKVLPQILTEGEVLAALEP